MNTVGERIAFLREKRGLSQPQLAKKLNVGTSTIGMWETGKRGLKDETLKLIADFFNVSTDYLLGRTDEQKNDPNLLVAAHIDDDVSEEDMEDILRYIEYRKKNPLPKK